MVTRPAIRIVCDHGIAGGRSDDVARFEWSDDQVGISGQDFDGSWVLPLQFTLAKLVVLSGDQPASVDGEPTRTHYEIPCPACTRRPYRADEARLQNLLSLIVDTAPLRDLLAKQFPQVEVTDTAVVVPLDALHFARDTLAGYGQQV